jgi:hypothetical protein
LCRGFLFHTPTLGYQKKDLNQADPSNRQVIGLLSRMVTNAIFLSHNLRENILVRIFVESSNSYLVQFSTDSIRYLAPQERSLGFLLLKAQETIEQKLVYAPPAFQNKLTEITPGFFLRLSTDPFVATDEFFGSDNSCISFLSQSLLNNQINQEYDTLSSITDLENLLVDEKIHLLKKIFYLPLSLNTMGKLNYLPLEKKGLFTNQFLFYPENWSQEQIVMLLNLILDDIQEKNKESY